MDQLTRLFLIVTVLLLAAALAAAAVMYPVVWLAAGAALIAVFRKREGSSDAHGSAEMGGIDDVDRAGMTDPGDGMIVGTMDGRRGKLDGLKALLDPAVPSARAVKLTFAAWRKHVPPEVVRLNKAVHTAVFAPTGVGKGVSCVLPMLLTTHDSVVCVDFKGENHSVTAAARKRMGHRVVRLDPFDVCGPGGDTFNPLDFIDTDADPLALDRIRSLANTLVIRTGQEKDPFWNDAAETWIAGLIAFVCCFLPKGDPNRSLQGIRRLLADVTKAQMAVAEMCKSDALGGMLSRLGGTMASSKDKELASVISVANKHTSFLDTLAIVANTSASTFDPSELVKGKATVYLVLPPEFIKTQSALLRVWIGAFLLGVTRCGLQEKRLTRFVLDEAASLGQMDILDTALAVFRGYGVRLTFIFQSLGQLKKCFPDGQDQTLLGNVTQVYFGTNDNETAKYVSERLGKSTISVESGGTNSGWSRQAGHGGEPGSSSHSGGRSDNWALAGRELLQPDEVMALDPRVALTFAPGCPPMATWLMRYYEPGFKAAAAGGGSWPGVRGTLDALALAALAAILAFAVATAAGLIPPEWQIPS